MEKLDSKVNTLFFHMGPGFHSGIERIIFARKFPHILFLDQPTDLNFDQLVEWTSETVLRESENQSRKLRLIGHSFGGQLIAAALPKVADVVSEIRLLNSAYDSFRCFVNLQAALEPKAAKPYGELKGLSVQEKLNLVFHVAQLPKFAEAYWTDSISQNQYEKVSAGLPVLNIDSFVRVFSEFLQRPPPSFVWDGPAVIYYSESDKLIQSIEGVKEWHKVFPKAMFHRIPNVGHHAFHESSIFAEEFFKN